MTAIKGTNSSDYLVGTDGDDRFTPMLGYDTVLGGTGFDTIVVDYSSVAGTSGNYNPSYIFANGSSLGVVLWASDGSNLISFADVERITGTLDGGDNLLYIYGYGASPDAFNLDGGGGNDRLSIDAEFWGNFDFVVGPNGKAHSTIGNFSNFESYEIALGVGSHQVTTGNGNDAIYDYSGSAVINAGAGDDQIVSYHSIDTINGGAGFDYWSGNYDVNTTGLSFTTDGRSAALSNGTSVQRVEEISLTTGSGDDQFTVTGATQMYADAGAGNDT